MSMRQGHQQQNREKTKSNHKFGEKEKIARMSYKKRLNEEFDPGSG